MIRRFAGLLAALCLAGLLAACAPRQVQETQFAMGTVMTYTVCGANAPAALEEGMALVAELDGILSANSGQSEIGRFNSGDPDALSPETMALVERAERLSAETGGAFTPWLGAVTKLWGFSSETPRVPEPEELADALAGPGELDLGGIAKGYTADRLKALWQEAGVESAIATLGGNVMALGAKPDGSPWRVGIRDPFGSQTELLGTLEVTDTSVVTSGGYERQFTENGVRYHHILDPETGWPADKGLASVTVVCGDSTRADALSTALFVLGKEAALEYWKSSEDLELILVEEDGTVTVTEGLWDRFSGTGEELRYVREE